MPSNKTYNLVQLYRRRDTHSKMALYKNKYKINSTRLNGYDYGLNGTYFVTICTKNRIEYFGEIIVETHNYASPSQTRTNETHSYASLRETPIGIVARNYWFDIPKHFPFVQLDEFQLMPNHLHGIIVIDKANQTILDLPYKNKFGPQSQNLSSILRSYKGAVKTHASNHKIEFQWQPRFYDHIIKDEEEFERIKQYIINNPDNWHLDKNNSENLFM